jgi:pSer/pThr/pTyr-binding forkhead associated (FHA) protein
VIVCPTCGKENQDHYKFCLGCGSDLPRSGGEEQPLATTTPPAGIAAVGEPGGAPAPAPAPVPAPAAAPEPEPAPAPAPAVEGEAVTCSACGTPIQPGFAFCGSCGAAVPGAEPTAAPVGSFAPDSARLVLINPDGTEGGTVEIPTSDVAVGRDAGGFFGQDFYLSPRHAVFKSTGQDVIVTDEDSLNGIFVKVIPNEPVEIKSGNIFRLGQELLLFEALDKGLTAPDGTEKMGSPIEGLWGRVSLIVGKGRLGNAFPVGGDGIILGRERGNILFPDDGYVSGIHARLHREGSKYYVTDLGSSNGSYVKVDGSTKLNSGDFLLMGAQLFRIDL